MSTFKQLYDEEIVKTLRQCFGYKSIMQVPKIIKITLNMGLGEALSDKKIIKSASQDMATVAGQFPIVTYARRSIAGFKIREGYPIGCKVTLRRNRMYDFLERLVRIAIPRIRDFRGLNHKSFDGRGNYSFGISEQIIFPEIDYDQIDALRGLDVTITTSAETDREAWALLSAFNFPFKERFNSIKSEKD